MISEEEIIRRMRAVYKSLKPFFNFNQLMEAMWIWESKYSREDAVSYNKFTLEICSSNELKDARSEIIKSMAKAMSSIIEDMQFDPYPDMLSYRNYKENKESREYRPPEFSGGVSRITDEKIDKKIVVFSYLIKNIYTEIIKSKPFLKEIFINKLNSMLNGLNPASKQAIGNILSGYGNTELHLTMEQQINTIHIIYVLSCEYVGAPATDKMFSRIFKSAEELPEAQDDKPKQWL